MRAYKIKVAVIIQAVAVISIIVFSSVLLLWHKVEYKELGEILIHYGLIILPITLFWLWFEKKLWSNEYVQKHRNILNIPPDIRGRWVGTLNREGEVNPHTFVLEVRQSLSKIQVNTYTRRSKSQSCLAEVSCDESEERFTLCFLWQGTADILVDKNIPKGTFYGYTILELFENETPKSLTGNYFTDRLPIQTKGIIDLKWVSFELKNKV